MRAKAFHLPDLGEGLVEAEIVSWRAQVGAILSIDDAVVEVETEKAVVEIPSPFAGVLLEHGGSPGVVISVGDVLFVVGVEGDAYDDGSRAESAAGAEAPPIVGVISEEGVDITPRNEPEPVARSRVEALPAVRKLAAELGTDLERVKATGVGGRPSGDDVILSSNLDGGAERLRSPLVRRLAARLGVDLTRVIGTGPGGSIRRDDVVRAAPIGDEADPASGQGPCTELRRPLSKLRRTIAQNLTESYTSIPQVTVFDEVDATRILAVRRTVAERHGRHIPMEALLIAAVVPALREHPEFNATLDGFDLVLHERYDLGLAVDTPDGLLVVTVLDCRRKGLLELAADVDKLAESARSRALSVAELRGQTFTVSNIGAVGGGFGTPLLPVGTVGIVSFGRADLKAVVRDGEVAVAPMMPLSLTYDHRVIDGAHGRRFLRSLMNVLEEPALILS